MKINYQISENGTIFKINEDGSIAKIAKLNDDGKIDGQSSGKDGYILTIILFIITSVIFAAMYFDSDSSNRYYQSEYDSIKSEINSVKRQNEQAISNIREKKDQAEKELSNLKTKVGNTYPIIINDIKIGNIDNSGNIETSYGNTIYSSRTMFLATEIHYTGIDAGTKTFKVKWFSTNGSLRSGDISPSGYTFSESETIYSGENTFKLKGWGNSSKGNYWGSGTYRIEIWYDDVCLKSKNVRVY